MKREGLEQSQDAQLDEKRDLVTNRELAGERQSMGVGAQDVRKQKSGSPLRTVLIVVVVLIVVAAVVAAGIMPREKANADLKAEAYDLGTPLVSVFSPKRGAPQQEIVLPGNIQAFTDSPIYARTNGYLKKWYFDIGARVKAGTLLAEIDTPEVDQQLDQARADLNTAAANMKLSQVTAERYEDLKSTDSVSKQDVDNAVSDYAAKKATVESAQHNVQRLQELQSFEKVYAPFDGVITARNIDVGYLINSGAGAPQQALFRMASLGTLRVYVNVPQQYSPGATPGLMAYLTLPQFPGRRFEGKLVRTSNAIDLTSRTLLVEVDVNNPRGELLPGAYTEVHLKLPETSSSYIVPVSALMFQQQGMRLAELGPGDHVIMHPITIGRDFGTEVEVVSGLTGREKIIDNPPDSLLDGQTVRVEKESTGGSTQ